MHILHFHRTTHGSSVTVSDDAMVVRRDVLCYGDGIAFSAQPLRPDCKVCVELSCTTMWSGAIRIGVTCHNPNSMYQEELPRFSYPTLSDQEGYWVRPVSQKHTDPGNRLTVYITGSGQMNYYVNNEHKGILLNHLPTYTSLWLLIDLYGNTTGAKLVPAGKSILHIPKPYPTFKHY